MLISDNWRDYELIDCSDGERLERWGEYILIRPDPQVVWNGMRASKYWKKADAVYHRSQKGGGSWSGADKLPHTWEIGYGGLRFIVHPTGFKHTGIFPEQAANWDWAGGLIKDAVSSGRDVKVLNLFAYTGAATCACAAAGASVCHVDAAKGMVAQAKENASLCGLSEKPIRYIVDDCFKFVEREIRRGNKYDAVIMDPPSYGRGPGGELWKLEDNICEFVNRTAELISDEPLFILINSYTTGLSPYATGYILRQAMKRRGFDGKLVCEELGLPVTETGMCLPCGASARWSLN